jgi:hypothetical protein
MIAREEEEEKKGKEKGKGWRKNELQRAAKLARLEKKEKLKKGIIEKSPEVKMEEPQLQLNSTSLGLLGEIDIRNFLLRVVTETKTQGEGENEEEKPKAKVKEEEEEVLLGKAFSKYFWFLEDHRALHEGHVVRLLLDDFWDKFVPLEWQETLLLLDDDTLRVLPAGGCEVKEEWPKSFQRFLQSLKVLALPRELEERREQQAFSLDSLQRSYKGMTFKKTHEARLLSTLTINTCHAANSQAIVDIGFGEVLTSLFSSPLPPSPLPSLHSLRARSLSALSL